MTAAPYAVSLVNAASLVVRRDQGATLMQCKTSEWVSGQTEWGAAYSHSLAKSAAVIAETSNISAAGRKSTPMKLISTS